MRRRRRWWSAEEDARLRARYPHEPTWKVACAMRRTICARISWFGRWRRYALFPEAGTVFEPTCLRDIAAFIDGLMALRRGGRT